jgi:AcrR family transcriptional regulator
MGAKLDPPGTGTGEPTDRSGRRPSAGQDPAKRHQILEGAKRCFLAQGFEAASMNDITAEAGVSKGTIYVYFSDKEDLFAALIERERTAMLVTAQELLDHASSVEAALTDFGRKVVRKFTSREVIRAQRMVLAVAERMPNLARTFFGPEPFSGVSVLKAYLDREVTAGVLDIADTELAARQFIELAMAGIFKRRLFGIMTEEADDVSVDHMVTTAVDMFLGYYRAGRQNS